VPGLDDAAAPPPRFARVLVLDGRRLALARPARLLLVPFAPLAADLDAPEDRLPVLRADLDVPADREPWEERCRLLGDVADSAIGFSSSLTGLPTGQGSAYPRARLRTPRPPVGAAGYTGRG
jgi:hypothetical protein